MFLSSGLIWSPASHVKNLNPLGLEENYKGFQLFQLYDGL